MAIIFASACSQAEETSAFGLFKAITKAVAGAPAVVPAANRVDIAPVGAEPNGNEPSDDEPPASHEQQSTISVKNDAGENVSLNTFCLDSQGRLLAGCGGSRLQRTKTETGYEIKSVAEGYQIRIFDSKGEAVETWNLDTKPEAICTSPDGAIFVGGEGRLLKLTASGEQLLAIDSPQVAFTAENRDKLREEAIASIQTQATRYQTMVDTYEKRIAKLEAKDADELTESEQRSLSQTKSMVAAYQSMVERYQGEKLEEAVDSRLRRSLAISSISANERDVYVTCSSPVGYGYEVWRLDHELTNGKKIITDLRGCCGQMDVRAGKNGCFVAENARHRVCHYDREGELVATFGEGDRKSFAGFAGCCNPMNVCFGPGGELMTAESSVGRIKRFSPKGELLGLVGFVKLVPGCKNVAIESSADGDRVYMLDITRKHIVVMARRDPAKVAAEEGGKATTAAAEVE
jgi:hypothetical protein